MTCIVPPSEPPSRCSTPLCRPPPPPRPCSPRTPTSRPSATPAPPPPPPLPPRLAARLAARAYALHRLVAAYLAAVDDLERDDDALPFWPPPELRHLLTRREIG